MRAKSRRRRSAAFLLAAVMAAASAVPSYGAAGFTDVSEGYWGLPYIDLARSSGLIEGYVQADGSAEFRPERPVTRQECLVMLYNTLKLAGALKEGPAGDHSEFYSECDPPVTGEPRGIPVWAREFVSYALDQGICDQEDLSLEVDGDGRSGGFSYASRELIAKWTARALDLEEAAFFPVVYSDHSEIDPGYASCVESLFRHGIMEGSGGAFHPRNGVKRAEMAAICTRILGAAADEAAGKMTSFGMLNEDGTLREGERLYDSAQWLASLKLADRVKTIKGTLVSADRAYRILTFASGEGEIRWYAAPGTSFVLDGKPVSLQELADLEGSQVTVSYYFCGEPAVVIQTGPSVQQGTIVSLKDCEDHQRLTIALPDDTYVDLVLTSSSVTQGDIKKNRSCRFIADGIEILEMR
ncbi:MAG: S-layer homology domain-containing protein [Firmicutes bacterium]|nr:S-layer homology domain-containing protein [Bacillota bacterium]MBQ6261750.1 S-layer homology domain-containing protein [Bacillota bacterium]MBR0441931.1 S-layer homology domain-containing protein [Bacillota bacterium]